MQPSSPGRAWDRDGSGAVVPGFSSRQWLYSTTRYRWHVSRRGAQNVIESCQRQLRLRAALLAKELCTKVSLLR